MLEWFKQEVKIEEIELLERDLMQQYYMEVYMPYRSTYEDFDRLPVNILSVERTMLISPKGKTHADHNMLIAILSGTNVDTKIKKEL